MTSNTQTAKRVTRPMIEIDDFRMKFGDKEIIKGLSFDVRPGEVFGFLGSNGSGKTTTLRALLRLYTPTSGTLHIKGKPYRVDGDVRLGYLPEERGLYKKETVIDVMLYFGQLKGMTRAAAREFAEEYLKRVDLGDKLTTKVDKLSGGQQQKVQLGVTIMNDPELLILDEPTKGFDPVNRRLLMNIIEERKRNGATIVFVTHHMEEVERLCDRIILLRDGAARAYGTISEVKREFGGASLDEIFVQVYGGEALEGNYE